MDKKEVEDFFFFAEEIENIESELRETNMKITKMESELRKETKEHKIVRLEKRIPNYKKKHETLDNISCDLFEELDRHCGYLAGYIMDEFEEEFIKKMFDRFVISELIQKIDNSKRKDQKSRQMMRKKGKLMKDFRIFSLSEIA